MKLRPILMTAALLAVAATASAAPGTDPASPLRLDRPAEAGALSFHEQRNALIAELNDGETYAEITPRAREEVMTALRRIERELDRTNSLEGLSPDKRVRVLNEQERINNLLAAAAADSRVVCRRERAVGSNFRRSSCMTVAERRRAAEYAQEEVGRMMRGGLGGG